jgi:hypothetical protein
VTAIVGNALLPDEHHDTYDAERARADLDRIYAQLDGVLAGRTSPLPAKPSAPPHFAPPTRRTRSRISTPRLKPMASVRRPPLGRPLHTLPYLFPTRPARPVLEIYLISQVAITLKTQSDIRYHKARNGDLLAAGATALTGGAVWSSLIEPLSVDCGLKQPPRQRQLTEAHRCKPTLRNRPDHLVQRRSAT